MADAAGGEGMHGGRREQHGPRADLAPSASGTVAGGASTARRSPRAIASSSPGMRRARARPTLARRASTSGAAGGRRRARPSRRAPCAWGSRGAGCRWPIPPRGRRRGGPARRARGEHRHRRDDGVDLGERPIGGIRLADLDDEALDHAAGAAQRHLDPHARAARRPRTLGDGVVEEPVELWEGRVDQHARDAHARSAPPLASGRPAARPQSPAAARRSSTRSVRSHVKSGSSRPKWPYTAVWA